MVPKHRYVVVLASSTTYLLFSIENSTVSLRKTSLASLNIAKSCPVGVFLVYFQWGHPPPPIV